MKVCVVGAGVAGLCAARHFCRLPQFFTVDVMESTANVGGAWMMNPDKCRDWYVQLLAIYGCPFTVTINNVFISFYCLVCKAMRCL